MDVPETAIQSLPKSAIRLIGSAQVITSVVSVVKELVENSLDAGATAVDVKLDNYGFNKLEVRDNGSGVKQSDTASMGLPHHTSKLTDTTDLESLNTYGFRGEALGSLCAVSRVSITTKTSSDDVSMTYELGHDGEIIDKKPSHLGQGTTVVSSQLFHSVPVRRQYYSNTKRRKEELKKVEDLVIAFSVIKHDVRFSLRQDRAVVWQKNSMASLRHSLLKVFGPSVLSLMVHKQLNHKQPQCELELYVPRPDADCHVMSRTTPERCFIFVNHRPITHKDIIKMLKQTYCEASGCEGTRWPLACLSLVVPPGAVDVNLEPNKTKVLLHDNSDVLSVIARLLGEVYGKKEDKENTEHNDKQDHHQQPQDQVQGHQDQALEAQDLHGLDPSGKSCQKDKIQDMKGQALEVRSQNDQSDGHTIQGVANARVFSGANTSGGAGISDGPSLNTDADFTLPLTKPLYNSTPCDAIISTQNITFDILKEFDETDDIFSSITDTAITKKSDNVLGPSHVTNVLTDRVRSDHSEHTGGSEDCASGRVADNPVSGIGSNGPTLNGLVSGCSVNGVRSDDSMSCIAPPRLESNDFSTGDHSTGDKISVSSTSMCSVDSSAEKTPLCTPLADEAIQWSRGGSIISSSGKKVQPVQLLLPGASLASPGGGSTSFNEGKSYEFSTPESKLKHAANTPGQMTLHEVTSSHVKKPTTAFIFFSKEVRAQVVKDNPDADFQTVAKKIGVSWKLLTPDQRQKYERMMTKDVERYRQQISNKKGENTSNRRKKRKLDEQDVSISDMLKAPATPKRKKRKLIDRATVLLEFSMIKLKESLQTEANDRSRSGAVLPSLVGEVRPGGWWVGVQQDSLMAILPWRMQEMLMYTQLMENHSIATHKLDEPIQVTQSVLGAACWETLLSLDTVPCYQSDATYAYLNDPRIGRSGFSVRKTQEAATRVEVISMATEIAAFSIGDLREVLEHITQNLSVSVTNSRPLKVKQFFQGEAVRMSRQMSQRVPAEEVNDLLQHMHTLTPTPCKECFHHRPFIHHLYNMQDLPLTQTQTCAQDATCQP